MNIFFRIIISRYDYIIKLFFIQLNMMFVRKRFCRKLKTTIEETSNRKIIIDYVTIHNVIMIE